MARTAASVGRDLPQPPRLNQSAEQVLRLIGVEALTKGFPANLLARYFVLAMRLNPPQYTSSIGVSLAETDLP